MPNGNVLLTQGSKQITVNPQGQFIWENKGKGVFGKAVIDSYGSIYAATPSSIQETLPNGAKGWSFTNFPATKSGKSPILVKGPDQLLYFPLPDALYVLDTRGHYAWSLFPWDSTKTTNPKTMPKRDFLAGAGDQYACYIVHGEKAGYRLSVIDRQGKMLWFYWLGDITAVNLMADGKGKVYVSANYKKNKASKSKSSGKFLPAKILCFNYNSDKPVWEQSFKDDKKASPTVLNSDTVYATVYSEINAFQAGSGSLLWTDRLYKLTSPVAVSPVSGRIYAGNSKGSLYALNSSGRMIWERQLDGNIERAPLITSDGTLYVLTSKGSLYKMQDNYK